MLTRSWPTRKRLASTAFAIAIIIVFIKFSNLRNRSSHLVINQEPHSRYRGNETDSETVKDKSPLEKLAPSYIKAILDTESEEFDGLQCPKPTTQRYSYLQVTQNNTTAAEVQIKYFFALNLRQSISILPRLLGSIIETVRFLGPRNCALSIVEGNSGDGTLEALEALRKDIGGSGLEFHLQASDIDPKAGDRIEALANLRNLALVPLVDNSSRYSLDAVVIFVNDVAICMEDMLELVHQRVFQDADMTCAMDWSDIEPAPIFYGIWVARAINGDTFWEIPPDGGWRFASNLFWNHPISRQRYNERKAFQVFACCNGAVVFRAEPVVQKKLQFRRSEPDECYSGEPRLFCKDMWREGYSKIAVVPSVNLDYSDKSAKKIKGLHGYVSEAVKGEDVGDTALGILWDNKPPEQVKCMADFSDQSWVPWNQGFEPKD